MAGSSRAVNFESMFKAMSMADRAIAIASSRIAAQHKRMAEIAERFCISNPRARDRPACPKIFFVTAHARENDGSEVNSGKKEIAHEQRAAHLQSKQMRALPCKDLSWRSWPCSVRSESQSISRCRRETSRPRGACC
ncbi:MULTISPECIES: hypothetical protein [Paraburkholderia]|uniref:Uncharacterized protein n=1 Tax=Paraburkholderia dilworthii TaxID=948106 RepID=A0ABW9DEJ6_9BURK|nr:hypothetical protein [Paraburkholderia bryophila]